MSFLKTSFLSYQIDNPTELKVGLSCRMIRVAARNATDEELETVHTKKHVTVMKEISKRSYGAQGRAAMAQACQHKRKLSNLKIHGHKQVSRVDQWFLIDLSSEPVRFDKRASFMPPSATMKG
jgi:hypothetical protein